MNNFGIHSYETGISVPPWILILLITFYLMTGAPAIGEGSMNPAVSEGLAPINGSEIYYRIIGEGKPLIFLHGGPGMFHDYFLPHVETLANDFQLIFYDQRASGKSAKTVPPESVNIENFARDLDGIREYFELEKVNLLGHSWGGLLALHYAMAFPGKVDRIVLVDSAPPNSTLDALSREIQEQRRSEADIKMIQEIMGSEAFQKMETQAVNRYFRVSEKVKFFNPDLMSRIRLDLDEDRIQRLMWVGQLMNPYLDDYDITEDLSSITVPVLILHGDYDTIPLESAEIFHHRIKGARLVVVKDCGHFPFIEAPEIFLREVVSFIRPDSRHQ